MAMQAKAVFERLLEKKLDREREDGVDGAPGATGSEGLEFTEFQELMAELKYVPSTQD